MSTRFALGVGVYFFLVVVIAQAELPSGMREKVANASPLPQFAHTKPLVIRGLLKVPGAKDKMAEGTFARVEDDDGKIREEYSFSNFKEVRIIRDNKEFIQRSVPYEILPLYFFKPATAKMRLLAADEVVAAGAQGVNGKPATCVSIRRKKQGQLELCFDNSTGVLVQQRFGPVMVHTYSEYVERQGTKYPTSIRVNDSERTWAELKIVEVTEEEIPASLFEPLPTAKSFTRCENGVIGSPKLIDKVKPSYPAWPKVHYPGRRVSIYGVIGTDGKLHDTKVVQAAVKELDDAAVQAVSQWRYEPVTCDSTPIEIETIISIDFN